MVLSRAPGKVATIDQKGNHNSINQLGGDGQQWSKRPANNYNIKIATIDRQRREHQHLAILALAKRIGR